MRVGFQPVVRVDVSLPRLLIHDVPWWQTFPLAVCMEQPGMALCQALVCIRGMVTATC